MPNEMVYSALEFYLMFLGAVVLCFGAGWGAGLVLEALEKRGWLGGRIIGHEEMVRRCSGRSDLRVVR